MKRKEILWLLACLAFCSLSQAQGRVDGFYKGKGKLDYGLGAGAELNNKFFAGEELINLSRTIISTNLFAAYGLAKNFDLNASIPFISTEGNSNIQDPALYLKYKLIETRLSAGNISLSLAGGVSTNLTDYETEGIGAIGQQATVFDIRPLVHYFSDAGIFATLQAGFQSKSDPTPDAVGASLKVGLAKANYYFDLWFDYQESDGGLNYEGIPAPRTFKQLGVDYSKVGGTFYKPIKDKLGYYIGTSYTLAGRNIGQGPGFFVGIVAKR